MFLRVISTGSKAGNCYALISDSGQILLLDFGCDKKKILRGIDFKVSSLVGTVLSHGHQDHSKSYKWLLENWIPIYTNDETAEGFETITGELLKGVSEKKRFQCGEFKIMGFYIPHDNTPNFGFLIEHEKEMGRLLYLTDLEYCPSLGIPIDCPLAVVIVPPDWVESTEYRLWRTDDSFLLDV